MLLPSTLDQVARRRLRWRQCGGCRHLPQRKTFSSPSEDSGSSRDHRRRHLLHPVGSHLGHVAGTEGLPLGKMCDAGADREISGGHVLLRHPLALEFAAGVTLRCPARRTTDKSARSISRHSSTAASVIKPADNSARRAAEACFGGRPDPRCFPGRRPTEAWRVSAQVLTHAIASCAAGSPRRLACSGSDPRTVDVAMAAVIGPEFPAGASPFLDR